MRRILLVLVLFVISSGGAFPAMVLAQGAGYSLQFFGNGTGDIDRVKIRLDAPERAVDVGGNFTIEFFMRTSPTSNGSGSCVTGDAGWTNGNTIIDRDIFGEGDNGDYGISLFGNGDVIAFGVSLGNSGQTICGSTSVADNNWHHIAVTRNISTGQLRLFVDGVLDGSATGPTGDVSYRNGRSTSFPNDPFLVIGAEKHDFAPQYPSYSGWIDELRVSNSIRYSSTFTPPTLPFTTDANTVGLYHFDEGTGNAVADSSGSGSNGTRSFGGSPAGPLWSTETPFAGTPPLNPPTLIAPTNGLVSNDNQPVFSWNAVVDADTYQIVIDNNSNFSSPEVDTEVNTLTHAPGVLSDSLYYWRVRGMRGTDGGNWSVTRTFTIDTQPPNIPNLVNPPDAFVTTNPTITLSWQAASTAVQYQLRLDTVTSPTQVVYSGPAISFSYTHPVRNGTLYWQVRAIDAVGNASEWSAIRSITIDSPLTAAPLRHYFVEDTPTLTWNPVSWATAYQVQVDNQVTFTSPEYQSGELSSGTLEVETSSLADGVYYWRVRAKTATGTWGTWTQAEAFMVDIP